MEASTVENEIRLKAQEWVDEYGEEFLQELIDVYLADTPNRLAQLRRAFDGGEIDTAIREAHTLKSSSANLGAMGLSSLAKTMEFAGRNRKLDAMAADLRRFEEQFTQVKTVLEIVRKSAKRPLSHER